MDSRSNNLEVLASGAERDQIFAVLKGVPSCSNNELLKDMQSGEQWVVQATSLDRLPGSTAVVLLPFGDEGPPKVGSLLTDLGIVSSTELHRIRARRLGS